MGSLTDIALAAEFISAATHVPKRHRAPPVEDKSVKSEPYTGRRAGAPRSGRPMRGNHLGSLS